MPLCFAVLDSHAQRGSFADAFENFLSFGGCFELYSSELNSAEKVSCISRLRPEVARTRESCNLFGRIQYWRVVEAAVQIEAEAEIQLGCASVILWDVWSYRRRIKSGT